MSEVPAPYNGRPGGRYHLELDYSDAQAVLLALALCSLDRPGWLSYLRSIAVKLAANAGEQFDEFRRLNQDRWQQDPPVPLA